MEAITLFNDTFNKYLSKKDKFDSLYIFVINKVEVEEVIEKVSKIISTIDTINDVKRKNYLKSRLLNFKEYLKINYKPETFIFEIFLIDENVNVENLIPYYKQTLDMFNTKNFLCEYSSTYPIEWLKKLLLEREYINVIKVKNNDISHSKINSTKKCVLYSDTIKSMDLNKILQERVAKGEKYLIHGVSATLKNFVDKNAIAVHTNELTDEQILKIVENSKSLEYHKELDDYLSKMLDPKISNKLVFGKDIQTCIKNSLLKTLYCSEEIYVKTSKIPEHLKNFEIKVIKQIEKGDISDRLNKDFSGALGIKYY
jgi:hypothetical protein